jgi:hypothetical protein
MTQITLRNPASGAKVNIVEGSGVETQWRAEGYTEVIMRAGVDLTPIDEVVAPPVEAPRHFGRRIQTEEES